jgi:hypothetical protein
MASQTPTDQLLIIAAEPTSPDLGIALMELDRRGLAARPSLQSLFPLLTSSDSNRRGLGMTLLHALYPSVFARLPSNVSNADGPDVWRARLAALDDQIQPHAANDLGLLTSMDDQGPINDE